MCTGRRTVIGWRSRGRFEAALDTAYNYRTWRSVWRCNIIDSCVFSFAAQSWMVPLSAERERSWSRIGYGVFIEFLLIANGKQGGYEAAVGRESSICDRVDCDI